MSSENEGTSRENYAKYALVGIVALVAILLVTHYFYCIFVLSCRKELWDNRLHSLAFYGSPSWTNDFHCDCKSC